MQTFPTADGWVYVMCMTDEFWHALLGLINDAELTQDERFETLKLRARHRAELTKALGRLSGGSRPRTCWRR